MHAPPFSLPPALPAAGRGHAPILQGRCTADARSAAGPAKRAAADSGRAAPLGRAGSPRRTARLEEDHALALALHMRDGGPLAPMLACRQGSALHRRAMTLNLPVLPLPGVHPANPLTLFRLWRWQRRHARLLVQTVGEEALALGHCLLRLRPCGSTLLAHAFLLRPPLDGKNPALHAAHKIFCGSGHVRARLTAAADPGEQGGRADPSAPRLPGPRQVLLAPGLALEAEEHPLAREDSPAGARCVFGLGEALAPRSGAQIRHPRHGRHLAAGRPPPWEVRALGGGPRYQELLDEALTLGVAARLCLLNDQPPALALPACRVWIAPGTSPEELPETLWSGVAAGLPNICTRTPLHRERLDAAALQPDGPCPAQSTAVPPPDLCMEENGPALWVPPGRPRRPWPRPMIAMMTDAPLRRRLAERSAALRPLVGLNAFAARACRCYTIWGRELGWIAPEAAPAGQS